MKRRVQDNSQVPHYLPFDDQNRAAKAKSVPPALSSSTNFQFHYSALSASSLASKTSREFETLRLSRHDNPILKVFNFMFSQKKIHVLRYQLYW